MYAAVCIIEMAFAIWLQFGYFTIQQNISTYNRYKFLEFVQWTPTHTLSLSLSQV